MSGNFWNIRRHLVEIKIGIFFLVALFLLLFALLSIKEVHFFKGTYIVRIQFNFAEGLRTASPVRFCGVDVGEVKKVEIKEGPLQPVVIIFAKIQNDVRIPRNSHFFINSLSLFGEKYLEISPPEVIDGYIAENEMVEGLSPISLFHVFATFQMTMKEVSEFVKEGKVKTSIENILANIEDVSLEVKGLIKDMKNKEGTIGKLLYDDSLYKTSEEFLNDLKTNPWKLLYKPKEPKKNR